MKKRAHAISLLVVLVMVAGIGTYLGLGSRPQLGLDLRGGISAIYTPVFDEGEERPEDFDDVLDETISVIRARIDSLGVAEPEIARQGDDVLVQLPGLDDADRAQEVIGRTAKLTFRRVEQVLVPGSPAYEQAPACDEDLPELPDDETGAICGVAEEDAPSEGSGDPQPFKYQVGPAELSGENIEDALVIFGQSGYAVQLDLDDEGGEAFAQVTADLACQRDQGLGGQFAIVLDNIVESAPTPSAEVACGVGITGGTATITVGDAFGPGGQEAQQDEAEELALVLRTGALPITLEPSTFETVSPTLGAESLRSGLLAAVIGLGLVAMYLLFFYRWLGLVAIGALLIFGITMTGIITGLGEIGFTLTLAGIAGIVVSIGITADSSIIFFERIRDEVSLGKTVRTAVTKAFDSAFRTNLAGNTVTLAAAIILYFLAVGPVRGFALTLGIATILDIMILYFYSRCAVGLLSNTRFLRRANIRTAEAPRATAAGSPTEVAR